MSSKPRTFGVLYQSGDNGFNIDLLKTEFAKYGGKITSEAAFAVPPGTAQADAVSLATQQMPTLIAKLKSDGVTTIINALDARNGLRRGDERRRIEPVHPEWLFASGGPSGGAFPGDLDIFLRSLPANQTSHSFGVIWFLPFVANPATGSNPVQWYWGTNKGSIWSGAAALVGALYTRLHLAGPQLTKAKMAPGALTGSPRPVARTATVCSPTPRRRSPRMASPSSTAPSGGSTRPDRHRPGDEGRGQGRMDVPRRREALRAGHVAEEQDRVLRHALTTSVAEYVDPPTTEPKVPNYPCTDCPSSGAATPTPSNLG